MLLLLALACADKADPTPEDTTDSAPPTTDSADSTDSTGTTDSVPPEETGCTQTTGELTGVVYASEGSTDTTASARVTARPLDGDPIETLTDEEGHFAFPPLEGGQWTLDALNSKGNCSSGSPETVSLEPCDVLLLELYTDACL